jgi:hypothetical protein
MSLYDGDPHGEQTIRSANQIKKEDDPIRIKQEDSETVEKSRDLIEDLDSEVGSYSLRTPNGKTIKFRGNWENFAEEVSREIRTKSGKTDTRYCEEENYDADEGSDNELDTPEAQAMIEGEVVNREIIKEEVRSKQAEEEIISSDFQTAISHDAKTQKQKTKDGKGRKSSKKKTLKKKAESGEAASSKQVYMSIFQLKNGPRF